MNNQYSKKLNIIPNESIGGVEVGLSANSLRLDGGSIKTKNGQRMISILDDSVFILFSDDRVFQVSALRGYEGKLHNKHYIGEPIANIVESTEWFFSELDDGFINDECAGVVIRCSLEDTTIEEIRDKQSGLYIEEISVYK